MCEVHFQLDNWFLPHDSSYIIITSPYQLGNLSNSLPPGSSPADLFINQADCMSVSINQFFLWIEIVCSFFLLVLITAGTINEWIKLSISLSIYDYLNLFNPFSAVFSSIQTWRQSNNQPNNPSIEQASNQVNVPINQSNNQLSTFISARQLFSQSPISLIFTYVFFQLLLTFGTLVKGWSLDDHQAINLLSLLFLTLFGQLGFINLSIKYVWSLQEQVGVRLVNRTINQAIFGCHVFVGCIFLISFVMNVCSFIFTTTANNDLGNESINHLKFIHASILFSMFSFSVLKLIICLIVGSARRSINQCSMNEILVDVDETEILLNQSIHPSNNQSLKQSPSEKADAQSMHAEYRAYATHARNVLIACMFGCWIDCLTGAFVLSTSPRYYLIHVFFINQSINQSFLTFAIYASDPLPDYLSPYVQLRHAPAARPDRSLRSIPEQEEDYENIK